MIVGVAVLVSVPVINRICYAMVGVFPARVCHRLPGVVYPVGGDVESVVEGVV